MKTLETLNEFRLSCSSCKLESFNGGLVNGTFYLRNSDASKPDYLLQRINPLIFNNIKWLMRNITLAMDYFCPRNYQVKNQAIGLVITKKSKSYYYRDSEGYYWRMYHLMSRRKLDKVKDIHENAYAWASAFGKFISTMDDLPIQSEAEIEPFDLSRVSMTTRTPKRIKNEINYVLQLLEQMSIMNNILREDQWLRSTIEQVTSLHCPPRKVLDSITNFSEIELEMNRNNIMAY